MNVQRAKKGIPSVPTTWKKGDCGYFKSDNDFVDWVNPTTNLVVPHHFSKRVSLDKAGNVLAEGDTYYSGKKYEDPLSGTMDEGLTMTYYYEREGKRDPWDIVLSSATTNGPISLGQADEILKSWGLSR